MRRLALLALALAACSRGDLRSLQPEQRAAALSALAASRSEGDWPALLVGQSDPSALVRKAAAGALTARGGPRAVEALGLLARDADPEVAVAAARGLAALPQEKRVRPLLLEAWADGPAEARPELAAALAAVGGAPREAVEVEARRTWERNVRVLQGGGAGRAAAAEELGRSGRVEAVKLLLPVAAGTDPALAAAAARGLGHAGEPSARPALVKLLGAPDAAVAEAAGAALAELGDPGAADPLALLARNGPERLAAAAVEALGQLPQAPEVGVGLCEVALRAGGPEVAARAARLARLRDVECPDRPVVAKLSRRGAELLAALGVAAELRPPPDRMKELADRLVGLVGSAGLDAPSRAAAARALGRLGVASAAPAVARRAAELRDRLALLRAPPAPPPAAGATAQKPARVEPVAPAELAALAVASARLKGEGAGALATGLLADRDPVLRAAGAEALGALGGAPLQAAAPLLADPEREVRLAAARALARGGAAGAQALSAAAAGAGEGDPAWSAALARALGDTGDPAAVAGLGALLRGPAAAEAAAALQRLGSAEGAAPLVAHLEQRDARGRPEALEALAALSRSAGPLVARDLWSRRPEVRAAAARAVGRLRHEAAAPWLEALRSDYAGAVRRAAVEALARLPSGPAARR